jgi:hypothetical protein
VPLRESWSVIQEGTTEMTKLSSELELAILVPDGRFKRLF